MASRAGCVRKAVASARAILAPFVLFASATLLPTAAAHGEGGPEVRQGTLSIRPETLGGLGYAETLFSLAKGDAIQYQWRVESPAGASVAFNVHGHIGAQVKFFNRTTGGSGGGSLVSPGTMKAALMWQSNLSKEVNVSYAVQVVHTPDLYSSAFFTANLAGLVLMFAAVWELSIRGKRRVKAEAEKVEGGGKQPDTIERVGRGRPSPGKGGVFSDWRWRAALYTTIFLLTTVPLFSYFARGEGPPGSAPLETAFAAFVAHESSANLTVVDPIRWTNLGEVLLDGPAVSLAVEPSSRLVYAVIASPPRLVIVDGDTYGVVSRADFKGSRYSTVSVERSTGAVWVDGPGAVEILDARNGAKRGEIQQVQRVEGFIADGRRAVLLDSTWPGRIRLHDTSTLAEVSSFDLDAGRHPRVSISPRGDLLFAATFDQPANHSLEVRSLPGGELVWMENDTKLESGAMGWTPDGSFVYSRSRLQGILEIRHAANGSVAARIPVPVGDGQVVVSGSRIIYVTSDLSANLTAFTMADWKEIADFAISPTDGTPRSILLDSTGSFAIVTSHSTGELVSFHDSPVIHYHSRLKVGARPTTLVLLEPPPQNS